MAVEEAESIVQLGYPDQLLFKMPDGSWQEIEEMKDFPDFGSEAKTVDVTHRRSPGQRVEKIATFKEWGTFSYEGNYHPTHTVQAAVRAAEGTKGDFRYVINDEETLTPLLTQEFSAWILSFKLGSPTQAGRKFMLNLEPSGELTES